MTRYGYANIYVITYKRIMIVCIAEKPSVAKEIADILGAKNRREGFIEGNGYQVTWTFGHLCTLKEPHDYTPMWQAAQVPTLPHGGVVMRLLERTQVTECPCHLITVTFDESLVAVPRPKDVGYFLGYTWFLCYTDYHYSFSILLHSKALKGV